MNYTVFFTNQCNMDCTYCYERNKMVRSISYDVLDDIVNFIVDQQRSCSDIHRIYQLPFFMEQAEFVI